MAGSGGSGLIGYDEATFLKDEGFQTRDIVRVKSTKEQSYISAIAGDEKTGLVIQLHDIEGVFGPDELLLIRHRLV